MQKIQEKVVHPTPTKRQRNLTQVDRNILWWLIEGDHLVFFNSTIKSELLRINGSVEPMSRDERKFMRSVVRMMNVEPDEVWAGANHGLDPEVKPIRRYKPLEIIE